jgi:hypothetical protein
MHVRHESRKPLQFIMMITIIITKHGIIIGANIISYHAWS